MAASHPAGRLGLFLGTGAVLFWSFGASLVFLGAREAGTWTFVAISSLAGGLLQILARRVSRGELRTAVCLPWRLWAVPVCCFVLYGLAWPYALALSTSKQVFGVSLINYLWPILTVLFSVWLVPGVRLTGRLAGALALALAGLAFANLGPIRELVATGPGADGSALRRFLPYGLALVAAVTWGVYSAILARWRSWAGQYVTSPVGFLLIGACAGGLVIRAGGPLPRMSPMAAWYLLWEMALSRARVQTLSLVAAATPVLSTFLLCFFLKTMPGWELVVAAGMVSAGVVLSLGE